MKSDYIHIDGLDAVALPSHIAMIMDGNGRWAQKKLLNRVKGHEKGADTVRMVVRSCREIGISFLTLYAFSTENWQRPKAEVSALMILLKKFLVSERQEMVVNNIQFNVIGEKERLPGDVQKEIQRTKDATKSNNGMRLNLALSYGQDRKSSWRPGKSQKKCKPGTCQQTRLQRI